ncbi:oligosaccharyl transferase subunit ost3/OST6 [Actinomortierella wolfii]|nr:oligosaccharyl transferase subunit ost3/OST6 [Actinomortierella wolfii]
MGLSRALLLFLVALVAILTISSSRVEASTPAEVLQLKVDRLSKKAAKNKGIVELSGNIFEEVLANPRNYSMVVLFTAMSPEFNCVPCKNFDPEYRLVAKGWSKQQDKTKLYYGVLDFTAGREIFRMFGMQSAPSALYFPATESNSGLPVHERYDFSKHGFQAEPFANWLSQRAGTPVRVVRPFDFVAFSLKLFFLLGSLACAHLLYTRAGTILKGKYIWAAISLFTIFVMISGHMWNHIRKPPYTLPGRDGRSAFMAQGFQNQLGLETQVVAVIYAVLCGSVISLISSVPKMENPARQRIAVFLWMSILLVMYSVLMQLFRLKNPAYPFRLLF